jgi:hypothetical protein
MTMAAGADHPRIHGDDDGPRTARRVRFTPLAAAGQHRRGRHRERGARARVRVAVLAGTADRRGGFVASRRVFAAAASLLATGDTGPGSPAGGCWPPGSPGVWLARRWNSGVLPMAGEIAQSSFFFCTGVATLLYPVGRLQSRWDLAWVVQAAVTLVLADLASFLFTRPEWNGFGPGALVGRR